MIASDSRSSVRAALPAWAYPALFCGVILLYWLPRLTRGFWIDEAGAYWVARGGWTHVWHTIQLWPTQSIVYAYLSTLFACGGPYKEALLRLPSVAGMLAAAVVLYKLTEDIVGRRSGWTAAIPFVCAGSIVEMAVNARPYALGLAVILLSFRSLREWVHTSGRSCFLVYCASSALVVYFHYPFVVIFAVQAIYLAGAKRAGRVFSWKSAFFAALFIATAALPLLAPFLMLAHVSTRWTTATIPTLATFISFYPVQVLIAAVLGFALFFLLHRDWFPRLWTLAKDDLVLLAAWLLLGPILMFAIARSMSYAIFATRFLIYALPPFFILLAWGIRQIANRGAAFALVTAIALSAALYVPQMETPPEWRTPLATAAASAGRDTPIILRSGFVESAIFDWKSEPRRDTHLFAPLAAYPVPNEIIPAPFFVDAAAERYLESQVELRERHDRRFCVLAEAASDALRALPAWFKRRGYSMSVQEIGGFEIALFAR